MRQVPFIQKAIGTIISNSALSGDASHGLMGSASFARATFACICENYVFPWSNGDYRTAFDVDKLRELLSEDPLQLDDKGRPRALVFTAGALPASAITGVLNRKTEDWSQAVCKWEFSVDIRICSRNRCRPFKDSECDARGAHYKDADGNYLHSMNVVDANEWNAAFVRKTGALTDSHPLRTLSHATSDCLSASRLM